MLREGSRGVWGLARPREVRAQVGSWADKRVAKERMLRGLLPRLKWAKSGLGKVAVHWEGARAGTQVSVPVGL